MGKKPVKIENYKPTDTLPPLFEPGGGGRALLGEDEKITATVTPEPTEDPWKDLEIPPFLRRTDAPASPVLPTARAHAAAVSAGGPSGSPSEPKVIPGLTGAFDHFRVDPNEIESKIKQEADRRWRAWVPTKEHLSRPRKSYYLKQVRKEYYP